MGAHDFQRKFWAFSSFKEFVLIFLFLWGYLQSLYNYTNAATIFLAVLEFELRVLHLLGKLFCLSHSANPFSVGHFQGRILQTICLELAWNHDPPDLCLLSS
jgi:hypothetical protein